MYDSRLLLDDHIYPLISDKISLEDFEANLNSLLETTGNMVNINVLGYMILSKYQRKPVHIIDLADFRDGSEVSVRVEISSVEPTREFLRKDGQKGTVITLNAEDVTGKCRIVLWDTHHQELVEKGDIEKGVKLFIGNTKMKEGKFGLELNPQKRSIIKILSEDESDFWDWLMGSKYLDKTDGDPFLQNIQELYEGVEYPSVNIKATVQSTGQLREFNRRSGGVGHVINFRIYDGTAEAILTLWDKFAQDLSSLKIGDIILIQEGRPKTRDGMVEIHSGYRTRIDVQ